MTHSLELLLTQAWTRGFSGEGDTVTGYNLRNQVGNAGTYFFTALPHLVSCVVVVAVSSASTLLRHLGSTKLKAKT